MFRRNSKLVVIIVIVVTTLTVISELLKETPEELAEKYLEAVRLGDKNEILALSMNSDIFYKMIGLSANSDNDKILLRSFKLTQWRLIGERQVSVTRMYQEIKVAFQHEIIKNDDKYDYYQNKLASFSRVRYAKGFLYDITYTDETDVVSQSNYALIRLVKAKDGAWKVYDLTIQNKV
ncbi:MAG: hypothetical protein SFH39_16215 [Candidatus Magnetobacterium sp. LHC-1]|nr:hypothetical protein [Nitrospirota bacterium]